MSSHIPFDSDFNIIDIKYYNISTIRNEWSYYYGKLTINKRTIDWNPPENVITQDIILNNHFYGFTNTIEPNIKIVRIPVIKDNIFFIDGIMVPEPEPEPEQEPESELEPEPELEQEPEPEILELELETEMETEPEPEPTSFARIEWQISDIYLGITPFHMDI